MENFNISDVFKGNAVIIRPSLSGSNYCFVCEEIIKMGEASIHCNFRSHQVRLLRFRKCFTIITQGDRYDFTNSLKCNFCDLNLSWDQAATHAQVHGKKIWKLAADVYATYFQHYLSMNTETHFCNLCFFSFATQEHALQHIMDSSHQKAWSQSAASKTNFDHYTICIRIIKQLITHQISVGDELNSFFCHGCKESFPNLSLALDHMRIIDYFSKCNKKMVTEKEKCLVNDLERHSKPEWTRKMSNNEVSIIEMTISDSESSTSEKKDIDRQNNNHPSQELTKRINLQITETGEISKFFIREELLWMISSHNLQIHPNFVECVLCDMKLLDENSVERHLRTHLEPTWMNQHSTMAEKNLTSCTSSTLKENSRKRKAESSSDPDKVHKADFNASEIIISTLY